MTRIEAAALLIAATSLLGTIIPAQAADTPDQVAIKSAMHAMFDRPDTPLVIDPVVVDDGFAVAGWTQGQMGGRAFLRAANGKWTLVLCSGEQITTAEALAASGVPQATASKLAAEIAAADSAVDAARLKKLASFEGTVRMDGQK